MGQVTDEDPDSPGEQVLSADTASDPAPPDQPTRATNGSVILLALYLLLMALVSIGALVDLLMAENDPISIQCYFGASLEKCKENPALRRLNGMVDPPATPTEPASSPSQTPLVAATIASPGSTATADASTAGGVDANKSGSIATPRPSGLITPKPSPTPTPLQQRFGRVSIPPQLVYGIGLLTPDSYLIWIVIFAGMLGAVARVIYSFYKHLGFGDFAFRWIWFYLLLPFFGPVLSLGIYFIIRGGFYTSPYGQELTLNLFSFAALAFLTGLFSENAMEKLHQIAVTLLSDTPPKVAGSKQIMRARQRGKRDAE